MNLSLEKNGKYFVVFGIIIAVFVALLKRLKSLFNRLTSSALASYHLNSSESSKVVNLAEVINSEVSSFNADEDRLISMINDLYSTNSVNALLAYYSEVYSRSLRDDLESVFNFFDWNQIKISFRNILKP